MGLLDNPPTRPRTYVEGTPVDPNDMNEIFDAEIDNRGSKWHWLVPQGRQALETNLTWDYINGTTTANPGPGFGTLITISPPVGSRITTIGARVLGTGAGGAVVVTLYRNNGDGTARTVIATLNIPAPAAAWAEYTQALAAAEIVADQKGYFFEIELPTTNQAIALIGWQS